MRTRFYFLRVLLPFSDCFHVTILVVLFWHPVLGKISYFPSFWFHGIHTIQLSWSFCILYNGSYEHFQFPHSTNPPKRLHCDVIVSKLWWCPLAGLDCLMENCKNERYVNLMLTLRSTYQVWISAPIHDLRQVPNIRKWHRNRSDQVNRTRVHVTMTLICQNRTNRSMIITFRESAARWLRITFSDEMDISGVTRMFKPDSLDERWKKTSNKG